MTSRMSLHGRYIVNFYNLVCVHVGDNEEEEEEEQQQQQQQQEKELEEEV